MLSFLHGMILLAGFGAAFLLDSIQNKFKRAAFIFILSLGALHLIWQAYLANYKYEADPSNPYVYAHTSKDIFKITSKISEVAAASAHRDSTFIEVICPGDDYWPLPWYLRSYANVGWWNHVNVETAPAPIIIASPEVEATLIYKLYEIPPPGKKNLYLPLFDDYVELRPQVELRGFVVKELWDAYYQGIDCNN